MSSERATGGRLTAQPEPFRYLQTDGDAMNPSVSTGEMAWNPDGNSIDSKDLVEQAERNARELGVREGLEKARSANENNLAEARKAIATALEQFKKERESYFTKTEPEVVQLALAIARKILHREAQMDPLLLMGVVHVALEKFEAGTRVRLRAHPDDVRYWANAFVQWNTVAPPEIIGDPALQSGECALETDLGSTHLSLDTQLKEIEQGFLDLLEQRPRVR